MENEQELILRAKSQDSTAFSMLMQRHANSLYKVAKAILKNDEDVAVGKKLKRCKTGSILRHGSYGYSSTTVIRSGEKKAAMF